MGPGTATTPAGDTTAVATTAGREIGSGTTGDTARAPGTEATAAAPALPAAIGATIGARQTGMASETGATAAVRTIGQSPNGTTGTGA